MRLTTAGDLATVVQEWAAVAAEDVHALSEAVPDECQDGSQVDAWIESGLPRIVHRLSALTAPPAAIAGDDLRFIGKPMAVTSWSGDLMWLERQEDLPWSWSADDIRHMNTSAGANAAEALLAQWARCRDILRTVGDDAAIKFIRLHNGQEQADAARRIRDAITADLAAYDALGLEKFHAYTHRLRVAINAALDATHNPLAAAPAPRLITRSIR
jgi:hypothetical protein